VALYLLNHKRERLREIELRYTMRVVIAADDAQIAPQFRIEKVRTRLPDETPALVSVERPLPTSVADPEDDEEDEVEAEASGSDDDEEEGEDDTPEQRAADAASPGGADEAERRRKRRRRRRRGGRRDESQVETASEPAGEPGAELPADQVVEAAPAAAPSAAPADEAESPAEEPAEPGEAPPGDDDPRNRRRGRRGGRRRRRDEDGNLSPFAVPGADQPELQPVYAGPTPADPFGGRAFDIFDVMDQAERAAEAQPAPRTHPAAEIVNNAPPEPGVTTSEPEPASMPAGELVAAAPVESEASPVTPEYEPEIVNSGALEPAGETFHAAAEPAAATPTPANDTGGEIALPEPPPPEPLVKPILIGADGEQPVERKRGWWRR
jgi:ribonuclease E